MVTIISSIISGLIATLITLIYAHYSQQCSFRIKTALKIVEECDKLFKVFSELKSLAQTKSSKYDTNQFMAMFSEFSGDVMIELAYGKDVQIQKYRDLRTRLLGYVMDMNQPNGFKVDRKEEEIIYKLKSDLFDSLIKDSIISRIKRRFYSKKRAANGTS
ncbi:MAG: hypothetical protein PVG39_15380 [Desulfobacteraceae bacterium]|jgi:hypothetical protein